MTCSEHLPRGRELQSGHSLAVAWVLSHWRGTLPNVRAPCKDTKTWWASCSYQNPRGLPHCLLGPGSREKSERRPWASAYFSDWFVYWLDHFLEFQCQELKACASHKEAAHTSQEQLKPAHPFIWLRTLRRTTKLNNL